MNPVTNAEGGFFGEVRLVGRGGARPSAVIGAAEGWKDKEFEARIRPCAAFTLIEILIVIGIILFLAGLLLAVSGFVQEKGKRSRAEAEIAAMAAALESYKADNGIYPQNASTNNLDPTAAAGMTPSNYLNAGNWLYQQLSGDQDGQPSTTSDDTKNYIAGLLKPNTLATPAGNIPYVKDPFKNCYGYSTSKAAGGNGYNPTYDLWSTGGGTATSDVPKWIKNW